MPAAENLPEHLCCDEVNISVSWDDRPSKCQTSFSPDLSGLKSLLIKDLHSRNKKTLIFCVQIKLPYHVSWANPVEFAEIVNLVHRNPVMLRNVEETILKRCIYPG